MVDVNLILETVKSELLENGRWVNVIGYVQSTAQAHSRVKRRTPEADGHKDQREVMVQAVLMWDAGAIRANEYEKTMEAQREAWRKTRHLHQNIP